MPHVDPDARRRYARDYYSEKRSHPRRRAPTNPDEQKVIFSTRLPMSIIARMRKLADEGIANHTYPWRSMAEVHKALLLRGFDSLKGDPMIDEMLPYLQAVSQIDGIASHRKEAQAAWSRAHQEILELLKIKAVQEAGQYFHVILHAVEEMSPNVWRDWMLARLKTGFPKLLTMKVKGIQLTTAARASDTLRSARPKRKRR